ncbi:Diadenosine tetraphosphate (Ap4A) hydrolase [Klenkia marina]|uniref:Diadenosine tetraphosphate (Ap4A) hydrolase n=2 Tax=Klenkia marina TaxID=1960309 RepID=A0A1G4Z3E2_9ACTN|nr:Diadenosine tetraphosphate (Ap4A) hydrolase [Klenkia marina]
MADLEARGVCLFCADAGSEVGGGDLVAETEHWRAVGNDFPYRGAAEHVLLVPRAHVTDVLDLGDVARAELWDVLRTVRGGSTGPYGLGMRNGPCEGTGGTIAHVHLHVLVPDGEQPLRMRFSSAR